MLDDKWDYKVKFSGYDEMEKVLEALLNNLQPSKEFIRYISKVHDVYIFFSFRSALGQMGFVLKPSVVQALAKLNIRFEVHILSFGIVDEDSMR